MAIGPIQLIALGFEDFKPSGKMLPSLMDAVRAGTIRLVDLQFVRKEREGNITSLEMSGLNSDERIEFGAAINELIAIGLRNETPPEAGSLEWALETAGNNYGMNAKDVQTIAEQLPLGGAAAFLMIEHRWATTFRDAVGEAGGYMMGQGFLTPETLVLIGAELQAQIAAIQAIEMADAVKLQSAREAARAVTLSNMIKQEAAREAVEALAKARLIEESAMEEATQVVAAAITLEEAALRLANKTESGS